MKGNHNETIKKGESNNMKITLKNNIMSQLGLGLSKNVKESTSLLTENYSIDDGLYIERELSGRSMLIASIPAIKDMDECTDGLSNDISYVNFGGKETNFFNIITPFISLRFEGKITFQTCSEFKEINGVVTEYEYINYLAFELLRLDIVKTDYNEFIELQKGL